MSTLRDNWMLMSLPVLVTMLGGFIATWFTLGPRTRSSIQHFSAGVVVAALAGEVIPEVTKHHAPLATAIGFSVGVGAMYLISILGERLEERSAAGGGRGLPAGLVGAVAVDGLVDGLVIGIGFTVGTALGVLVSVALSLEMFFLGLATAATLRGRGSPPRLAFLATLAAATTLAIGVVLGVTLFSGLSEIGLASVLAFGSAALLYLVTEELLNEAHTVPETRLMSSIFFLGFLVLLMIEMAL